MAAARAPSGRGFTLIELLVVLAIVALLASIAAPRYFNSLQKSKETALRSSLATLRDAIDQFHADRGRYPDSLEELEQARYVREIPEEPLSGSREQWATLPPPADAMEKGAVYDVHSMAAGLGSDGRRYAEW
jgi:general secretion pathway protein G